MEFRPNKVRLYSEDYIVLTMMGMPVLKSMFFKINDNIAAAYWQKVIVTDGNYPLHLIENHIKRMKLEHQAGEAVRNKLKDKLRRFFYEHKIKNNRLITKSVKFRSVHGWLLPHYKSAKIKRQNLFYAQSY